MWRTISILLMVICLVLFFYLLALKRALRDFRKEVALTKNPSYDRQLTVSLFDKDLTELAGQINENLAYQKSLKLQSREAEQKWKQSVSDIAHDLRTPLTVIRGNLQMLQKEFSLGEKQQYYLSVCQDKTQTLNNMVNDFFEMSVLESDMAEVPLEQVDITRLLVQFIVEHETLIREYNLTPDIQLPEKSVFVNANTPLVQRILSNLLTNVIKHAKDSFQLSLVVEEKEDMGTISKTESEKQQYCDILFSNFVDEREEIDVERLFSRTYQGSKARGKSGAGLGLYIVSLLAKKQGAEVFAVCENHMLSIGIRYKIVA